MTDKTQFPIDVTYQVIRFRDFLVTSWASLDILMTHHNWDDDIWFSEDWIQVNWEFFMERELLGKENYLIPLRLLKRITSTDICVNYKITCEIKDDVVLVDWIEKNKTIRGKSC